MRTLAIDIGGTDLKLLVLDARGRPGSDSVRVPVPAGKRPAPSLSRIASSAAELRPFDRAAVGVPGPIVKGRILTAVNLHSEWVGVNLESALRRRLRVPVRAANDADVQGYGAIQGKGVELVLTLGTGVGSALFVDGTLVPNLELGHHPFRGVRTYEELLGQASLKRHGLRRWSGWLREATETLRRTFVYRRLYLGGGNARLIEFELPPGVKTVSNRAGLTGGFALWEYTRD